ncbi:MAG: Stk1 family PASTA domain-containing Ser/Thr kinase [Ruminococcus sp.]|nr:Stk1 family PASTA domain-containing Ser/Thr kinase [Ruminococcus sp.]
MDKNIGKKLDGRYEITELIGVGGMAEVYKGVDVIDNKNVAIKILKKEFAENEEFLRRFRNESKAVAVLSHPNIVKIYDMGFSDKIQYIVMEYIDGITLKEYIEEEKVLTPKDTVHFIIQILRALQHAHDKGIVHRDIKPQNIMMFSDGTIKVMDFGIAKFAREEGKTATDQAIGSVHYISPEQASGSVTDAKSDIYSVGAMMYEMLTGRKPFDSDNPVAIAVMHMKDTPERPRSINPDIPDGLEEIVLRAMEKAPEDRYQTAAEMIGDIERFKANPNIVFGYYQEVDEEVEDTRFFSTSQVVDTEPGQSQPQYGSQPQQPAYAGAGAPQQQYGGQPQYSGQPYPAQQPYGGAYNNEMYYEEPEEDEEDEDEDEDRPSLVVPVLTAIVVVVIIVAVIFIGTLLSTLLKDNKDNNDWKMPNLIGMDFNDAVALYGNNIQLQEDGKEYNEAEPGVIIEQSLEEGAEFKKGVTVKVKISKGMETVEVPDVVNMNADLAKDQMKMRDLVVEVKNSSSADVQKGYVIKTEPAASEVVHVGSTVILYVSMGSDQGQISVDDYVGWKVDEATVHAEYRGLKVVTKDVASYEKEGTVVKQSIEKNEKVEVGTEIVFEYSNGKVPDGEIPFTIPFPSDANGRFVLSFMIKNDDGTITTQETPTFFVPEMLSITQNVQGSGEEVYVTVMLTNLNSGARATLGTYWFNFADNTTSTETEDIVGAFTQVGGFQQPTEAPTEAPEPEPEPEPEPVVTEAPYVEPEPVQTEPEPVVTEAPQPQPVEGDPAFGYYDENGAWIWY